MAGNPYHDENGKFCSKELMGKRIDELKAAGDPQATTLEREFSQLNIEHSPAGRAFKEITGEYPIQAYSSVSEARRQAYSRMESETVAEPIKKKAVKKNQKKFFAKRFPGNEEYGITHWTGSNYDRDLTLKDVAKNIREDIKNLKHDGDFPKDATVSIRKDNWNALDIKLDFNKPDKDVFNYTHYGKELKPEYQQTVKQVEAVANSYNYDNSEPQFDNFNTSFYGAYPKVVDDYERGYNEAEKLQKKRIARAKEMEAQGLSTDDIAKDAIFKNLTELREKSIRLARKSREVEEAHISD